MINNETLPPPPANNVDIAYLTSMFALLADPEQSKQQLAKMLEARQAWASARDEAISRMRESEARIADHQASMKKAQAEHSAKLRDLQAEFERSCAAREAEINQRDQQSRALATQAAADAATAAALKADLERRVELIRKAGL